LVKWLQFLVSIAENESFGHYDFKKLRFENIKKNMFFPIISNRVLFKKKLKKKKATILNIKLQFCQTQKSRYQIEN
jgi:hypothetical protein